ncbi:hypothetical protein M514_28049 [Trichuris suis]|uniref:Uncharacterized protein n=1 Tax=Trichuris suis TaxID=68888 RepID=A0A085MRC6_9BILA|nr:hypothetical protein M514_28049 [Trichuris suis]
MAAVRKLLEPLFCLASVSATEKALSETFAQAAVNAINKDESSGETNFTFSTNTTKSRKLTIE